MMETDGREQGIDAIQNKDDKSQPIKPTEPKKPRRKLPKWAVIAAAVIIAAIIALVVYLVISNHKNTANNKPSDEEKILTLADLDNPDVDLSDDTSDASVESLTKELKAKIDKQIAAKENPIETVEQLVGVLFNTTNKTRQNQLADFLQDFLANHEDAFWFENESGAPDQAQVNYWKAQLYVSLVYNYEFIMLNKFSGFDGKPLDTTKEQLKYVDLYLALANDPKSHPFIPEEDRDVFVGYVYDHTEYFLELKDKINEKKGAQ